MNADRNVEKFGGDTFYGGFTASKIRRLIQPAVIFPADFRRTNIRRRIRRSAAAEGPNRERRCADTIGTALVAWTGHFRC